MKQSKLLMVALGVACLAALAVQALAQGVMILKSFPADSGRGYYRDMPDGSGAVGPEHVVDFDGLNVVVHDKATGRVLKRMTQVEFWSKVEPANTLVPPQPDSPRMLYDPVSSRWIAVLLSEHKGHQYLAVSTSVDPTKPWKGGQLSKEKQQLLLKIGVDRNGFYMTINSGEDCIVIPKADLIAPGGPDLANMVIFHNLALEALPATDFNPAKAPDAPEVLLNKEFGDDCGKLFLYKVTWKGKTPSISDQQVIPLSKNYRTRAQVRGLMAAAQPAPGDIIRTDAGRRTDSVYPYGDSVYGVNCARLSDESRQGILWYQVRVSDGKLLQEGYVYDPNCDYFNPTLAVDQDGNVGISCTKSSATEFPSAYVLMHAKGDAPNTMRKPVVAVPGTTYFRVEKPKALGLDWGRYSVTCIDPSNPRLFWTCQEYAGSEVPGQWCTAWVSFQLEPTK